MKSAPLTVKEGIDANLAHWCWEKGTHFEQYAKEAGEYFMSHNPVGEIIDLGGGDGASGLNATYVDINQAKLDKIEGHKTVCMDILSYLKSQKSIDNVFSHAVIEHLPNPKEVLDLIGKKLKKGGLCLIIVPTSGMYSVHLSEFEKPEELVPEGCEAVELQTRTRGEQEYWALSKKI